MTNFLKNLRKRQHASCKKRNNKNVFVAPIKISIIIAESNKFEEFIDYIKVDKYHKVLLDFIEKYYCTGHDIKKLEIYRKHTDDIFLKTKEDVDIYRAESIRRRIIRLAEEFTKNV